jgi:hypothetical protein
MGGDEMANLFDSANSPLEEPEEIVVGDYVQWRRMDLTDYSPSLYTATYVARVATGNNTEIQIVGTSYQGGFLFTANSSTSSDFIVGEYHWQLEILRNSDNNRIVVDRGLFKIIPDLDVNGSDPRSHADIMLKKIESILQGRADGDVASYSINGRSLTKIPLADLMTWRDRYKVEVLKETKQNRRNHGLGTGNNILVRF